MKPSTRTLIRARAGQRCEYCRLHEDDLPLYPFHVEHILPKKHGGTDDPKGLAWSCHYCNLGLTPCGRATIAVLNINTAHRINLRELLTEAGRFFPWPHRGLDALLA
jgi:hypothetical protein